MITSFALCLVCLISCFARGWICERVAATSLIDIVVDKNHHNYKTAYLTVNVRPDNRVYNTQLHESPVQSRLKPQTILLEERQGNLTHQFEAEGTAAICFRSSAASEKNPMRFGLTVEHIEMDYAMKEGSGSQKANLDKHLSHMEMEMRRIQTGMDSILNEADFQKDQDHAYHEQFDAMHKATTFWPMMQVCILIATGIVQASHVVKFFQSRRII